ncbi:mitochondrial chaperone Tcm62p [Monosporozyma unispora]
MWSHLKKYPVSNGVNYTLKRFLKTRYTVVQQLNHSRQQNDQILEHIRTLDKLLNSVSSNKNLLYKDKYKAFPQIVSGKDYNRLDYVIQNYLKSLELDDALYSSNNLIYNKSKLGTVTLQLLRDCASGKFHPWVPLLVSNLLATYNKYPYRETLNGIRMALKTITETLAQNKILINDPQNIDTLINSLCPSSINRKTIKQVLRKLDYKLFSDDIVRVTKGKRTFDEIELSKGWNFLTGIMNSNEPYLRSLDLIKQKLITIKTPTIVLVCDGSLQSSRQILPTIAYMNKTGKSVLLLISGDCGGEALSVITINNNKNKRNDKPMRIVLMKYSQRDNNNLAIQENQALLQFLKLPQGINSIYSCEYSDMIPSTVSANQYFGEIESFKATTGEALLYNNTSMGDSNLDEHLHTTLTLNVGGENEMEIDARRNLLDHLINDIICQGLSSGFVTGHGVALVKTIPKIMELLDSPRCEADINVKVGIEAVLNCLCVPMEKSLENEYGLSKHQISQFISKTMDEEDINMAYLPPTSRTEPSRQNLASLGILEPWNQINAVLTTTSNFLHMFSNCKTVITSVLEKPKKQPRPS